MESLVIAVAALIIIAACNQLAPRVGVASPLILLTIGIGIGFLPWVGAVEIEPEIILEAVLPPLLFSAAVAMPVMDFRRELRSVSLLAVGLVGVTTLVLGFVIHAAVPAVSLPWAFALGAVLSPTDAVAVSIARGSGVSPRIITILEGEGLFNDATALVLLASATSAAVMSGEDAIDPAALGTDFLVALGVAIVIGWIVGEGSTRIRALLTEPTVDTTISFTVPFIASVPAEHFGGSGLVAAVVAGLVVSYRGPRILAPASRRAAQLNWHTVELILEGGIFLTMGLQAWGIVDEVESSELGLRYAAAVAVLAGALTVVIRACFVAPLLAWLRVVRRRRVARVEESAERLRAFEERLVKVSQADAELLAERNVSHDEWERAVHRWGRRLEKGQRHHRRARNDLAYFSSATLGPREGAVIVWAGMRGAVTLAAAQTLPLSAPMRPFLLLVALFVAAGSLVIQGLTLGGVIRLVRPQMASGKDAAERDHLIEVLSCAVKETALGQAIGRAAQEDTDERLGARGALTRSFSTVGRALAQAEGTGGPGTAVVPSPAPPLADPGADVAARPAPSGLPSAQGDDCDPESPAGRALMAVGSGAAGAGGVGALGAARHADPTLTPEQVRSLAIEAIHAQRSALLDARDEGLFSAATLSIALERLDAEEVMLAAHH